MKHIPILVHHLSFSYNERPVLKDISIACQRGTFTTIIGPNGSGKTTLLRNISGWLKPKAESVFIYGDDISFIREKDRAKLIACLRQEHAIGFDFTVYDVVLLGRSPYISYLNGPNQLDRKAVEDALVQTGIAHLKNRNITTLSGGEMQRAYIAQALAQNADILLLDEPVTHLDIKYQIEILSLIKKLQEEHTITVLAVLHELNLAALFSDHIIFLKDGELFSSGTPVQTITQKNIEEVFGISVEIIPRPDTTVPNIFLKYEKGNSKI